MTTHAITTVPPASPPVGQQLPRVTGEQVVAAYIAVKHFPQSRFGFNLVGDRCEAVCALYMANHRAPYNTTGVWIHLPSGGNVWLIAMNWFRKVYDGHYTDGFVFGWQEGCKYFDEVQLWADRFDRHHDGYWDGRAARLAAREFESLNV